MKNLGFGISVALICTALLAGVACASDDDAVLVHAAASLVDVLGEIEVEYERATGRQVRLSYAGSNLIANQIVAGAPADAVLVAGMTPIDKLIDAGKARRDDVVEVVSNRLVVVQSKSSEMELRNLDELIGVGRIAMPDPATAPAGEYFESALWEKGLYERLSDQIVPTLDVRAALAAVSSGNVAYAFVYRTDAMSIDTVEIALSLEGVSADTMPRYYALPLDSDDAANDFIEFLLSPKSLEIFGAYGFVN